MCAWSQYSIATLWMLVVSHGVVSGVFEKKACLPVSASIALRHGSMISYVSAIAIAHLHLICISLARMHMIVPYSLH